MHETGETLPPPECPAWCESSFRGWNTTPVGTEQRCECSMPVGTDVDGSPVSVQIVRFAFLESANIRVLDPLIEIRCTGRLDDANASRLSRALARASAIAATGVTAVA